MIAVTTAKKLVFRNVPDPIADNSEKYFNYPVSDDYSGTNFGQSETRDGYITSGSYQIALPDGRIQTVTYNVNGDGGYIADVRYEGETNTVSQNF